MIKSYKGKTPKIGKNCYISPAAVIIGDVTIGDNVSIWECAVLRGDEGSIIVGDGSNVQDNATIHTDFKYPCVIGKNVTVGHNAIVHGASVEDTALIGMGAIVLNGAVVGEGSIIGAGALVAQNKTVPKRSLAVGSPFSVKRSLSDEEVAANLHNAEIYQKLIEDYVD